MSDMTISTTDTRHKEGASGRRVPNYAWLFVVVGGLIWLAYGAVFSSGVDIAFHNGPPSAYSAQALNDLTSATRLLGVLLIAGGVFLVAIGYKAFRRGEKWAWYTVATVPFIGVLVTYVVYLGNGGVTPTVWISFPTFGLFPLLGLLFSFRSIFPRRQ